MAEEESGLMSPKNLSTFVAVTFVLALLSLILTFYTFNRTSEALTILGAVDVGLNERQSKRFDALEAKVKALEAELAKSKAAAAAAPAPAEGGGDEGGE